MQKSKEDKEFRRLLAGSDAVFQAFPFLEAAFAENFVSPEFVEGNSVVCACGAKVALEHGKIVSCSQDDGYFYLLLNDGVHYSFLEGVES